jgi:hypothetical protein
MTPFWSLVMTTPVDQLPGFVWTAAGGLIVVRATASTCRHVVRQWVLARRDLARDDPGPQLAARDPVAAHLRQSRRPEVETDQAVAPGAVERPMDGGADERDLEPMSIARDLPVDRDDHPHLVLSDQQAHALGYPDRRRQTGGGR